MGRTDEGSNLLTPPRFDLLRGADPGKRAEADTWEVEQLISWIINRADHWHFEISDTTHEAHVLLFSTNNWILSNA